MCYKHDQFVGEPGSETYRRFFVFCSDLPRHELASLSKGSSESGHSGIHGEWIMLKKRRQFNSTSSPNLSNHLFACKIPVITLWSEIYKLLFGTRVFFFFQKIWDILIFFFFSFYFQCFTNTWTGWFFNTDFRVRAW